MPNEKISLNQTKFFWFKQISFEIQTNHLKFQGNDVFEIEEN